MSAVAEKVFPAPRPVVFAACTDNTNVVRCFKPYGPIPGVTRAELRDAEQLAVGVRRTITTSDGVTMDETILGYEVPALHHYRWGGELKPPFSWLVRTGTGHWTFSDEPDGTRVRWTYTFALTTPLVAPVMWALTFLFGRWMKQTLDGLADVVG